mmetsp:Transcript_15766/g.31379  ORF Transcript_15766/g.31379 Transcript_15766/m.31379 type:complete len:203 (-) Transcript_15766:101-709(-)
MAGYYPQLQPPINPPSLPTSPPGYAPPAELVLCQSLEQDASTLLQLSLALGKTEEWLRNGQGDNVARWRGVGVKGGRVISVDWNGQRLVGAGCIPSAICTLSALRLLRISYYNILVPARGSLPPEIGYLQNLKGLYVHSNGVSTVLPPSLARLRSLKTLSLRRSVTVGTMTTDTTILEISNDREAVQAFLAQLVDTNRKRKR